jgi:DNA-binding MarR family transcriptional regulator
MNPIFQNMLLCYEIRTKDDYSNALHEVMRQTALLQVSSLRDFGARELPHLRKLKHTVNNVLSLRDNASKSIATEVQKAVAVKVQIVTKNLKTIIAQNFVKRYNPIKPRSGDTLLTVCFSLRLNDKHIINRML